MHRHRRQLGVTLVEVMMVILLMSVLSAIVLPSMNPSVREQLQSVAEVVANDMAYARSLAVTNASTYCVTFDLPNNRYYLEYSGTNGSLATLPMSAFYSSQDTALRRYTSLNYLPGIGTVTLAAVGSAGSAPAPRTQLEFGAYGQTTQVDETDIWLTAGSGTNQRYIMVRVNPITGLASIVNFQVSAPPTSIVAGS